LPNSDEDAQNIILFFHGNAEDATTSIEMLFEFNQELKVSL
jgi:hypothetical protein